MKHLKYITLMLLVVLSAACEQMQLPEANLEIKREKVTDITDQSAVIELEFYPIDATIQKVEAYYTDGLKKDMLPVSGFKYRVELSNLNSDTEYQVYYKVKNAFSSVIVKNFGVFRTAKKGTTNEDEVATPEYVDLGLSVKWATFNVGATKPEEYGDYFAWGETESKNTYSWSTYKWCNGSSTTLTKYCTSSSYGTVDNKNTLDLSDDAAAVNWGGSWRMPTDAELTELRTECTWAWATQNGVKGYKVTSKSNNRSIFLPTAGYRSGSLLNNASSSGNYWSSSLNPGSPGNAYLIDFPANSVALGYYARFYGQSVRPVYDSQSEQTTVPTVTTGTVTQITEITAMAAGTVTSDGGASVTERGVVYSTSTNPTTASNKVISGNGTGSFTCNLTGLQPNTTYYVRAYAVNSIGTSYGEQESFTTNEEVVATPEYVDLGLSVKWATFNVGATKPEEYGDYFAWGETESKNTYSWSTYKWCNGSSTTLTKYCTSSSYGTVDNKKTLELSDDAAYANWGGEWRTPTDAELTELRTQCTWTWTTQNGVNGYKVTGTNGNSIFLPAAGYRYSSSLGSAGSYGYYWSSTLEISSSSLALNVGFNYSYVSSYHYDRYFGRSVRPVYGPQKEDTNNETYFSVSDTKKVTFSKGNLQYHPANNQWRFAENQTDYIGDANSNCSSTYNGWLDLFGWSTIATNFGVSTSTSSSDYTGSFVDWGTNKIGADAPNTWRTLTAEEWSYLLNTRTNASSLKGVAQVNGVNGLILLPDHWKCPADITFKSGFYNDWRGEASGYGLHQTLTAEQWSKLESAGAVFLPAAGRRYGSDVNLVQESGYYWSATEDGGDGAYCIYFGSARVNWSFEFRYCISSVRLVKDL